MDEVKFETEFLNDYFKKILGKETFNMIDLKKLKDIVITADKQKITQYDFDIMQELGDGIRLEGINLEGLSFKYAIVQFTETEFDEMTIEKINSVPVNRLFFPSLWGLNQEILDKLSDRFKYLVIGDALASKDSFYTYYTKQEMKIIISKLEEIKEFIPDDANDITKFMIVYKWIGLHASYNFSAIGDELLLDDNSYNKNRENIIRIARSLLGVLIKGEAVCQGYAWASVICLNYIGIPARVVIGLADGERHSWIQVKIDSTWYNACLTTDYKYIRLQAPLNFCLRSDTYFRENGFEFWGYPVDIDAQNEVLSLEKCLNDYPRDSKGNLLNDKSSFIDEHYKNLLSFYQFLAKNELESRKLKRDLNVAQEIEEESVKGGKHI